MEKVNPYNQHNKLINTNDIVNIMETLNINDFKINDILLYQRSFVHKSYCIELYKDTDFKNIDDSLELQQISYETMEFLGDSILGSVVCSYLYERFYKIYGQNEGFLTYLKNRIVCGESLAHLSNKLGFNRYLIISKHIEDNCDGRNNKNILEDVFEAFIGAVYLDNDYETVKNDLNCCSGVIDNNGTILCDDYNLSYAPGVKKAIDEFFSTKVEDVKFRKDRGDGAWFIQKA